MFTTNLRVSFEVVTLEDPIDVGRRILDLGGLLMDQRQRLGGDADIATEAGPRPHVDQQGRYFVALLPPEPGSLNASMSRF